MIEIYLLEQLDAFAKYGTLSEAAQVLHITQPTLSRSMQKLEDLLGFPLFEREKKRLYLNATGKLAAEYARRILDEEAEMEQHLRNFHHNLHTLNIGSIAPGPLMDLLPKAASLLPEMTISSTVDTEEALLKGLGKDDYGVILLHHPVADNEYVSSEYLSEQLYLSIGIIHPASALKQITFKEADGQSFIMYAQVGFWEDIVRNKMPHSHFLKQESLEAVGELAKYSEFPSFSTNITQRLLDRSSGNRVNIPFSDEEARVTYYMICKKKNYRNWKKILTI